MGSFVIHQLSAAVIHPQRGCFVVYLVFFVSKNRVAHTVGGTSLGIIALCS